MTNTNPPCIEVKNVSFHYADQTVLDNINFTVDSADYVGILGPNGSGKTTLLKIILGLLEPSEGMITVFGEDRKSFKDAAWIGYVPQWISHSGWQFPATVEEVVRTGRTAKVGLMRRFSQQDQEKIEEAMQMTDVLEYRDRLVSKLSGGERQRVFIARALASEPRILILDEPTVGVDMAAQDTFYALLRTLNTQLNMTILFVSHDIDVLTHEAKTILCLNKQLVCHVSSRDFISKPYLEELYGKKGKYILHGHNV